MPPALGVEIAAGGGVVALGAAASRHSDGCFTWLLRLFESEEARHLRQEAEREKFEQVTKFLMHVPLLKQLPKAELPIMAQLMKETVWRPGATVVRQGRPGNGFFLIYSGCASVKTEEEPDCEAILSAGDWLGGHTLTAERLNVATVTAQGPEPLVTLSMTKEHFVKSGLKGKLIFMKRPAMHPSKSGSSLAHALGSCKSMDGLTCSEKEVQMILKSMHKNVNLRIVSEACSGCGDDDVLRRIAESAEKRRVKKGTSVAEQGHLGHEFFIISSGSFTARREDESGLQRSAEGVVASRAQCDRLVNKLDFFSKLNGPKRAVEAESTIKNKMKQFASASFSVSRGIQRASVDDTFKKKKSRKLWSIATEQDGNRGRSERRLLSVDLNLDLPITTNDVLTTFHEGDSFGELSLLYNTRREATFVADEDSVVFVIDRRHFKELMSSRQPRLMDYCELLDRLDVLSPLLRSERKELAMLAKGLATYKPGEVVIAEGVVPETPMWFVVYSGSAILETSTGNDGRKGSMLCELQRGGYFGERCILRDSAAECGVSAGPSGLRCLTFDGEMIKELFMTFKILLDDVDNSINLALDGDIRTWGKSKAKHSDASRKVFSKGLESLQEVCLLGKGGFGRVVLVFDPNEKQMYALKRMSKGHLKRTESLLQVCWERDLLSMLDSKFVCGLYRTFKDDQFIYLLMEAVLGGNLMHLMTDHSDIFTADSPRGSSTAFYVACVVAGIEHLHERKIVYRDVKPENIMLTEDGYGKVCDMGLARFVLGKTNTQAGTPDYMPPEMIEPPHFHDTSADWWSVGVLTFELLHGHCPFDDEGLEDQFERLLAIRRSQEMPVRFTHNTPYLAKSFVNNLLKKLPARLGASGGARNIREHSFFKYLDFEALHKQRFPSPLQLPWERPQEARHCDLHSRLEPDPDLFEHYEDDGTGWDDEF